MSGLGFPSKTVAVDPEDAVQDPDLSDVVFTQAEALTSKAFRSPCSYFSKASSVPSATKSSPCTTAATCHPVW